MDKCIDNRFEIIGKAKQDLLNSTNIETSKDEMKVLDSFLFRCWQMGWLKQYNLTSDAEGEEMLVVKAETVRNMYAANERIKVDFPDKETGEASDHINHVLRHLFGSKCLPVVTHDYNGNDFKTTL